MDPRDPRVAAFSSSPQLHHPPLPPSHPILQQQQQQQQQQHPSPLSIAPLHHGSVQPQSQQPPSPSHFMTTMAPHGPLGLGVLDDPFQPQHHQHQLPHPQSHPHAHLQRLQTVPAPITIIQDTNGFGPHPPLSTPTQPQASFKLEQQSLPPPPPPPAPPLPPPSHIRHQSTAGITSHQLPAQLEAPTPPHSAPPLHGFAILPPNPLSQSNEVGPLEQEDEFMPGPSGPAPTTPEAGSESRPHGQLVNRIVLDPPDLDAWRQRLFAVDETIVLTNDQFETYFPHIDNVYSHRSTQKYKKKPFVSHYWDCRMKGRPPGTPKSNDPAKKKRKRNARERDLCDVKIKITEYSPGATIQLDDVTPGSATSGTFPSPPIPQFGAHGGIPGADGQKFWTIQRVNGNGGNGKGDGVAGPHKHTLAKSDDIKKSTVVRYLMELDKKAKKSQKPVQRKASGLAMATVKKHTKEHELRLYAACFDPFSQRVWIALEAKGMQYQYVETDPYKRPTQLLEANPRGLVPAIRNGDWASGESAVILEYLEDHEQGVPLFPTDPRLKANCRLWIDHINSKIVPSYFALVRALDVATQADCIERLRADITALIQAASENGPFFLGNDLCLVDIHLAPFVIRLSRMMTELRGWNNAILGPRWHQWVSTLEQNPHVQATMSSAELYHETFELFTNSRLPHGES